MSFNPAISWSGIIKGVDVILGYSVTSFPGKPCVCEKSFMQSLNRLYFHLQKSQRCSFTYFFKEIENFRVFFHGK